MPGDYFADLGIVVATAHIAFRKNARTPKRLEGG